MGSVWWRRCVLHAEREEVLDNRRLTVDLISHELALPISIRMRDALVLAQMLSPRFDHEPFNDVRRLIRILGHAPGIGTIAPSLVGQGRECAQERVTIRLSHVVMNEN